MKLSDPKWIEQKYRINAAVVQCMRKNSNGLTGFVVKKSYLSKEELLIVKTYKGLHPIEAKLNKDVNKIVTDVIICGRVKRACWDTGYEECAISKSFAKELNLPSIGISLVNTLNGNKEENTYLTNLKFIGGSEADNVEIIEHDFDGYDSNGQKIDILIGMSVISKGNFTLKHTENGIDFTFDFV